MNVSHPRIGICPIIEGRRESLEAMTRGMAQRVATLFTQTLRSSDGAPVECVVADTTVGGAAEVAACGSDFRACKNYGPVYR